VREEEEKKWTVLYSERSLCLTCACPEDMKASGRRRADVLGL